MIIPNPKKLYRLFVFFPLLLIGLNYYSCRKDSKSASTTTDPVILQAKSWYESTYPASGANTNNSLITQSSNSTTGSAFNFTQHIKPDWGHTTSYTRLNDKVIEMPLDSGAKYNFGLKNQTANKLYANLKYSSSYYLVLNDGKNYEAYLMVVIADSAYVKNDLTKLSHNTYRKHDADFSGMVFYFTPKGEYVSGYLYKNGQLVPSSASTAQQQNSNNSTLKTNSVEAQCTDYYWEVYNTDTGAIVSLTYMYTLCGSDDGGGGGGGGAPAVNQCPNSPAPTTTSINGLKVNSAPANPGTGGTPGTGDGGFPPPPTTTACPVNVPTVDTLLNTNNLTQLQKDSLQTILNQVLSTCLGQALNNYFAQNSVSFPFTANPHAANPAQYNPASGAITVQNFAGLTPDGLQEELFHAYQNKTMPGGTAQYIGQPGSANIEFEAKVLRDMNSIVNGTGGGFALTGADYNTFIENITSNYTSLPTSFTSAQLSTYFSLMSQFIQDSPGYSNDIINPTLNPEAIFTITNSSSCTTH